MCCDQQIVKLRRMDERSMDVSLHLFVKMKNLCRSNMSQLSIHLRFVLLGGIIKQHPHMAILLSLSSKSLRQTAICAPEEFLHRILKRGIISLYKFARELGVMIPCELLTEAAKSGNAELCTLINGSSSNYSQMLRRAARRGHLHLCVLA